MTLQQLAPQTYSCSFRVKSALQFIAGVAVIAGHACWFYPSVAAAEPQRRISASDKIRVFGDAAAWQRIHDRSMATASAELQAHIRSLRTDIQQRGRHYTVGITPVSRFQGNPLSNVHIATPQLMPVPAGLPFGAPTPQQDVAPASCLEEIAQPTDPAVDMRDYGIVTVPTESTDNQGDCGACWAFATTNALETSILLANGSTGDHTYENFSLSKDQVYNCTGPTDLALGIHIAGNDCGGGLQPSAANYVKDHSIARATGPFSGIHDLSICHRPVTPAVYQASRWGWICDPGDSGNIVNAVGTVIGLRSYCFTPSNESIKQAIVKHGSVVSSIYIGGNIYNYTGGVYDENDHDPKGVSLGAFPLVNHVIQMIGWDDAKQAWLIKNSWGPSWGENGFAWIKYNTSNIGSFAIWLDAKQFNQACGGEVRQAAIIKNVQVLFDNMVQGKSDHVGYTAALIAPNNENVASYELKKNLSDHISYATHAESKINLNIARRFSYQELSSGQWSLRMTFEGPGFNAFYRNEDWKSNVALKLIFDDNRSVVVRTRHPIYFHTDAGMHNAQVDSWWGPFRATASNASELNFGSDFGPHPLHEVSCQGGLSWKC
jgi:hypothetical protein